MLSEEKIKEILSKKEKLKDSNKKYQKQFNKLMEESPEYNYEIPFSYIKVSKDNMEKLRNY